METKRRVVYIEDEPEMIDLVRLILNRRGYEIIGANGGREGLDMVRAADPGPGPARPDDARYGRLGRLPADESRRTHPKYPGDRGDGQGAKYR